MDPATLAMNAIALIAPYLKHTAQRAADHVTDAAAKRIAGWVKEKLIGHGEPEAVAMLEEAPEDVTARDPGGREHQEAVLKDVFHQLGRRGF